MLVRRFDFRVDLVLTYTRSFGLISSVFGQCESGYALVMFSSNMLLKPFRSSSFIDDGSLVTSGLVTNVWSIPTKYEPACTPAANAGRDAVGAQGLPCLCRAGYGVSRAIFLATGVGELVPT